MGTEADDSMLKAHFEEMGFFLRGLDCCHRSNLRIPPDCLEGFLRPCLRQSPLQSLI